MSIATVVTMGYGSFGSVYKLPTLGFSMPAVIPDVVSPIGVMAGQVYQRGVHRGQVYNPGIHAGQLYNPGIHAGGVAK